MQTYSNFTVGGSLSVNVHGRYVGLGPVILSVKEFTIVLADGSIVIASPTQNKEIFYSAIGGMGGIGVIADVTLFLADNQNLERIRIKMPTEEYLAYFKDTIRNSSTTIFHNGDLYPLDFDHVSAVSWNVADKAPTTESRLIPEKKDYWFERVAWVVMSEWWCGRFIREYVIDPLLYSGAAPVHTRNYEASYDVAELEPKDRKKTTYVLQEYFVPVDKFDIWVPKMKKIFTTNDVNVINVSIRHALPDSGSLLAWAKEESFAFVVYYKQGTDDESKIHVANWTRQMIDEVLSVGGTYYLPYQIHATEDQFHKAYPHALDYFSIKKKYDPTNKFTNKLWDTYYNEERLEYYKQKKDILSIASTTSEYFRPYDNAYLGIPEWYIVYNAEEYARVIQSSRPSQFPYWKSIKEYWRQYDVVTELVATSTHNNTEYDTVLQVIGWSFTAENIIKFVYESTIGKVSEYLASYKQVPEDVFAAQIATAYGSFVYDYPWYEFPYGDYLYGLQSVSSQGETYTIGQNIRRIERKMFLSLEFGAKYVYANLIKFLTQQKFGVQDDIIYAIVSDDDGKTTRLLQAPHYHPFTQVLLGEMERARMDRKSFSVLNISGNEKITLAYLDMVGANVPVYVKEIIRHSDINLKGGQLVEKERIIVEVLTKDLFLIYKDLYQKDIRIEHLYDY
jgi:FAD/FMN-containing dehydrogenase